MRERIQRVKTEGLFAQQIKDYGEAIQELEDFQKEFCILRKLYERAYWEEQYVIIARAGEDNKCIIPTLYKDYMKYKGKHEKLPFLANNRIDDIPRSLKEAEATMLPLQKEAEDFLKLCREMVDGIRAEIYKRR